MHHILYTKNVKKEIVHTIEMLEFLLSFNNFIIKGGNPYKFYQIAHFSAFTALCFMRPWPKQFN